MVVTFFKHCGKAPVSKDQFQLYFLRLRLIVDGGLRPEGSSAKLPTANPQDFIFDKVDLKYFSMLL